MQEWKEEEQPHLKRKRHHVFIVCFSCDIYFFRNEFIQSAGLVQRPSVVTSTVLLAGGYNCVENSIVSNI